MLIFKVLRPAEWAELAAAGSSAGSPADRSDGFVHFSTAEQLAGTLERHFPGETGLLLLAVEADGCGDALRWEPSRGSALFAHLYRPLALGDIVWRRGVDDGPLPGAAG
jgi:uncharacterized protein (DUF952 family)